MNFFKIRKNSILEYTALLAIMGLAFYLSFIPHRTYLYPIHVDEWVHMAYSEAIQKSGSITFINPFLGNTIIGLGADLEIGFHLFLAVFQQVTGISWLTVFRYFPSVIFIFTILSVYIFAKREGFGLTAAFFTALIPTTVGILGPAFLVPVAMGLLFTPLLLFLAFNFKTRWSYLAIFILITFLLAIHAPSAISPIIIITPYILLNLKGNFKHSLSILIALLAPFILIFPWITGLLVPTAKSLLTQQSANDFVQLPTIVRAYGYIPTAFCLIGVFALALKGGKKNYGLVLGLLAISLMLVVFFVFHYGVPIMYERGLMYSMLMISIVAGAGLISFARFPAIFLGNRTPSLANHLIVVLFCLIAIGTILSFTIPNRNALPYYLMIDDKDYQAFAWIKNNVDSRYDKAILDPWKATAFTAVTGRSVYTRIHNFPMPKDDTAYTFINSGASDTSFLTSNNISIIYTPNTNKGQNLNPEVSNPDLTEVANNIYILKSK